MDKIEELLRKVMLIKKDGSLISQRTVPEIPADCPNEAVLAGYLGNSLNQKKKEEVETHISECLYCLEQLNLAHQAQKAFSRRDLPPSEQKIVDKAKKISCLAPVKPKKKGTAWLLASIVAFALSFLVPRYFLQFLAAAVILGIKWALESDAAKTLIMILDKRHKDKEEDLPEKVKDRLNKL